RVDLELREDRARHDRAGSDRGQEAVIARSLAVLAIAGCGSSTPSAEVASEEVAFTAGDHKVPGTLVLPAKRPAAPIVLMAGSGTTDRDWNTPLITSKNGSGKLLAEALAKRGYAVLRFDKAAIGANKVAPGSVTLDTYRDEGRAALAFLRTRPEVDA